MWKHPPNEFSVNSNKVDIWKVDLDVDEPRRQHLLTYLSTDETDRANRFKFTKDYERYISARGTLRSVLGKYLKTDPADIVFDYGEHGKPFLSNSGGLEFNISHSANLAVFAFTKNCEIGVDLELIRSNIEVEDIAKRFFSENEVEKLWQLPKQVRSRGFFNCWTRKEAFIKAVGDGLSFPLDKFEVSLAPPETAKLLATDWDPDEVAKWSLYSFIPEADFVAALAIKGQIDRLDYWEWEAVQN